MSVHDQQPARPRRRQPLSQDSLEALNDAQQFLSGELLSADPGMRVSADGGDRQASPGQYSPPGQNGLPEQPEVGDHGGIGEALAHFIGAVGNLLGESEEATEHFWNAVGNLIGALLEAHGNLD